MKKRKDKIEAKYAEYKVKFAGKSNEEMENSISHLESEIEDKTASLKKIKDKDEKAKLEAIISKMQQERDNMAGYNKNKDKIEKIRSYKDKLNEKIQPLKEKKAEIEKELEDNKKSTEERLQEINQTLKDPKKTENLDQNQYNDLLIEKEKIENEREAINKRIAEVQKRIEALETSVSKCNLAWRSLFNDKTWDEIQVRAMNNKKYTKKQSKENNKENKKTDKEKADKEESIDIDIDIGDEEVKNNKGKEETSLTQKDDFAERHPILAKIRDWFKGVKTSISRKLSYADYKKIGKDSEEVEETTKESKGRDAFIEELRRHVENDKADKELAYIEKHKAKTKTKEESEEEIEK